MKFNLLIVLFLAMSFTAFAEIRQDLGVDQNVDYASLTQYGPWDDRNYNLTAADLAILPADDQYLANVPAFFKVEKRKEQPNLGKFYPRSTYQHFKILHGGMLIDGIWYLEAQGKMYHKPLKTGDKLDGITIRGTVVSPDVETVFEVGVAGNEVSVECNPTNGNICVAGSNASGGQRMYYSTDAGTTWTLSQINPSSCCDPTIDWSSDGSIVYQADLSSSIGVRWSRSLDQGVTWEAMKVLTPSGSDKEWIHVDRSSASPHVDNVYLTYHNGNVMQFARSTDFGQTMSSPLAFPGEETGIGSDIATDSAGNIYYVYPGLQGGGIRLLKSTDGGLTFAPGIQVAPLTGRFDFPIPSMETREAFIYVSVDVDSNDNIYVAFTDEADDSFGGGNGSASQNHGVVKVYKSSDGGATWSMLPYPHDTSDTIAGTPIDRYHPWLMVDEVDNVHIGFYDTRNSVNRTGVDFYYNVSTDGGASWLPEGEQRYSTQTSSNLNDGQEWGDYNGLSVVMDKIVMTWTDNRSGKVAMSGAGSNLFFGASFFIAADPTAISVCANDTGNTISLDLTEVQGYTGTITLSESSTPGYVTNGAFSSNSTTAPFTSDYTFDVDGTGTTGVETLTILASGDDMGDITEKSVDIDITYSAGVAGAATLQAPADTATNVSSTPSFSWTADPNATSYLIEVATDDQFSNIVVSEVVGTNSYQPGSGLQTSTEHFWRVTSQSPCGDAVSSVFSFTTTVAPGECPVGTVQTDLFNYTFQVDADIIFGHDFDDNTGYMGGDPTDEGFTVDAQAGDINWALTPGVGNGGSDAFQADDLPAVNDTRLITPTMSLPTGVGPLAFRFWNEQTIEDGGAGCYDAGQLLISVGGGAFTQITDPDIINNAYDGEIDGGFANPASGEDGWCGDPLAGTVFNIDINAYEGQDVQLAFRMVSDSSVGRPEGWVVDDVKVTGCEAP